MGNGLSYKKLDLHVHTKGSYDFEGEATAEEIIAEALKKKLDGMAITDHNSGVEIDNLKRNAEGTGLVIFPGVEITCEGGKEGIHVIALFDPRKGSSDIVGLLEALGICYADQGKTTSIVRENIGVIGVIDEVTKRGGLAIPAHANSTKGILCDIRGQQRARIIKHKNLYAIEATDFNGKSGKKTFQLLDGSDPTYKRKLAVYQSSDNRSLVNSNKHDLQGIGSRFSYFKMENINLDSLKQCFLDPETRIRQEGELIEKNFPRIIKVEVNSGYLKGQEVNFHTGLNSIIGAKGSGKSILIELMRFALNQEPTYNSIKEDHDGKLILRLGEYGEVKIIVQDETGKNFIINRAFKELDSSPYGPEVTYEPAQIFPVLFLSQNEIIKIAENEGYQLEFIDRYFNYQYYKSKIEEFEKQLEKLDLEMAEELRAFGESDELKNKIITLEQEIKRFDKVLANPLFENFKIMEAKEELLNEQKAHLLNLLERIKQLKRVIEKEALPIIPDKFGKDPVLLRNRDSLQRTHNVIAQEIETIIFTVNTESARLQTEYKGWEKEYLQVKKEYDDFIKTSGGDYQGIALSRDRANRQLVDLQRKKSIVDNRKKDITETSNKRNTLLDSLEEIYNTYTTERKNKCEKFQRESNNKLKLQILDSVNVEEFKNKLLSLKRGSYLREEEINSICTNNKPRELVIELLRYDAKKESESLKTVAKKSNIDIKRMITLAEFLLSNISYEELLSLQYRAIPKDIPDIQYQVGEDNYQPLENLSIGQKCTAMLIMALSDGTMPIVIDQPEDSLDIRSIWNDMCTKIRRGKECRQFIFTTHSSSLAVASDTDCFTILEGTATNGKVVYSGSMDHYPLNVEVLNYLEGGKDTYHIKSSKYDIERIN